MNQRNLKMAAKAPPPPKRENLICPECGSAKLRRSHSRGIAEQGLKYLNQRAYRCKECSWRGRLTTKSHKGRKVPSFKGYSIGKLVFVAAALLLAVYLLIYLVDWAQHDSAGPTGCAPGSHSYNA